MNFCLNRDVPDFEARAVVDADVAAERLSQINRPEGLGEEEEAGEAHGVGGVAEEEAGAVGGVGGGGVGGEEVGGEEGGEAGGGEGVVEDVLAGEEIGGVDEERGFDEEGGAAQPHHPEGQRVRPLRRAHLSLSLFPIAADEEGDRSLSLSDRRRRRRRSLSEIQFGFEVE